MTEAEKMVEQLRRLAFLLDASARYEDKKRATEIREEVTLIEHQASEIARLTKANSTRPDYDLVCEDCGRAHIIDTSLPSKIWNQIAKPENVLCTVCIDRRLAEHGLTAEAEFYYAGTALVSRLYGHDEHESQAALIERQALQIETMRGALEACVEVLAVQYRVRQRNGGAGQQAYDKGRAALALVEKTPAGEKEKTDAK